MFQSPKFSTVVFTPEELKYWDRSATPCTPFVPTLVHLESEYETHTILLRNPSGRLPLAGRQENWIRSLEKSLRECNADLRSESAANNAAREWWRKFIGEKATDSREASGLFKLPDLDAIEVDASFVHFIPFLWSCNEPTAAEAVRVVGHTAVHRRTVNSSLGTAERLPPPPSVR